MNYLHTMVRIADIDASLHFYCDLLGLQEQHRSVNEAGRYTIIFLVTPEDFRRWGEEAPCIELTYNWEPEEYTTGRNFGHLAFQVQNIYETCRNLQDGGVIILRPPRDGYMAFVQSPDSISIELLQQGPALAAAEPWASMANTGSW